MYVRTTLENDDDAILMPGGLWLPADMPKVLGVTVWTDKLGKPANSYGVGSWIYLLVPKYSNTFPRDQWHALSVPWGRPLKSNLSSPPSPALCSSWIH